VSISQCHVKVLVYYLPEKARIVKLHISKR